MTEGQAFCHETIKEGVTIFPVVASAAKPLTEKQRKEISWQYQGSCCGVAHLSEIGGKEWTLAELNGKPVAADQPPTLKFEDGRVAAFGGVNRLSGSYEVSGGKVTFGAMINTRMAGAPEVMEQEASLARALATVDGFEVSGNELLLSSKGAVVARFRTAP